MITVTNKQRTIPIDLKKVRRQIELILKTLKRAEFEVNVRYVSDREIAKYNEQFRKKQGPTDVLSCPTEDAEEKILGDILIAPSYVKKDAIQRGVIFEDRMRLMLIHGILHLMGYDHISDADYKVMRAKEISLERKLFSAGL